MPNWCDNEVTITGKGFKECAEALRTDQNAFDFNKIIPMPDVVRDTVSGSVTDYGMIILGHADSNTVQRYLSFEWVKNAGVTDFEGLKVLLRERCPEAEATALKTIRAIQETGYADWYSWALKNWGTKWNTSEAQVIAEDEKKIRFGFDTAWSPPEPVIVALSEKYPKLTITLRYWEGGGGFRGMCKCKGGVIIDESSHSYSGPRGG